MTYERAAIDSDTVSCIQPLVFVFIFIFDFVFRVCCVGSIRNRDECIYRLSDIGPQLRRLFILSPRIDRVERPPRLIVGPVSRPSEICVTHYCSYVIRSGEIESRVVPSVRFARSRAADSPRAKVWSICLSVLARGRLSSIDVCTIERDASGHSAAGYVTLARRSLRGLPGVAAITPEPREQKS